MEEAELTKCPSYPRLFQPGEVEDLEDGDKAVCRFRGWGSIVGEVIWRKSAVHVETTGREAKVRENWCSLCIKDTLPVNFIWL